MALSDSLNRLTDAVSSAISQMRSLAETIRQGGAVGESATAQLEDLAGQLETAVSEAQQSPSGGTEEPPPEA